MERPCAGKPPTHLCRVALGVAQQRAVLRRLVSRRAKQAPGQRQGALVLVVSQQRRKVGGAVQQRHKLVHVDEGCGGEGGGGGGRVVGRRGGVSGGQQAKGCSSRVEHGRPPPQLLCPIPIRRRRTHEFVAMPVVPEAVGVRKQLAVQRVVAVAQRVVQVAHSGAGVGGEGAVGDQARLATEMGGGGWGGVGGQGAG